MKTLIILLTIVEELGRNKLLDLIRDCAHGIVSEIWARLVNVRDMSR